MEYQHKPGYGSMFKNENRANERAPALTGKFALPHDETFPPGTVMDIAAWVKESKAGNKYYSCQIRRHDDSYDKANNGSVDDEPPF